MRFSKGKWKVLYLGRNNPICKTRLETSFAKSCWTMSWPYASNVLLEQGSPTASWTALGRHCQQAEGDDATQRYRDMSEVLNPGLAPQYKRDMDILEHVWQRAAKTRNWNTSHMRKGWENWDYSTWRRLTEESNQHVQLPDGLRLRGFVQWKGKRQ